MVDELDHLDVDKRYYSPSGEHLHPDDRILAAEDSILMHEGSSNPPSINDITLVDDGISTAQSLFSNSEDPGVE